MVLKKFIYMKKIIDFAILVNKENPVDAEFCLKFIKTLLRILETNGLEVEETLYDILQEVQLKAVQPQLEPPDKGLVDKYFKSYFIEDQVVSLAETKQIIRLEYKLLLMP